MLCKCGIRGENMDLKSALTFYKIVCETYSPIETECCPYNRNKEKCEKPYECILHFLSNNNINLFIDISRKWQLMSFSLTYGVAIEDNYEKTYENLKEARKRGDISIEEYFSARETLEKIGVWN